MLGKVKAFLDDGLFQANTLHADRDQFDNVAKYLKIYNELAKESHNSTELECVVPTFLRESCLSTAQLT